MLNYNLEQLSCLRKSSLCMYCLDGVPLKNGMHNLFGIEDVPCNEYVKYESEDISGIEQYGATGCRRASTDPTKS